MVVHCHGQSLFSDILPDDVLVEETADLGWFGNTDSGGLAARVFTQFLVEDTLANIDATVTDIDTGTGDEFTHLGVAFATERAHRQVRCAGHKSGS
jgi:hypothetical protein